MDTLVLQAELGMIRIKTPADMRDEAKARRLADPEGYERMVIAAHADRSARAWTRWGTSEMRYEVRGSASDTARAMPGDAVTVRWKGRSLPDGAAFDEQLAFTWRYGDPDQVIAGVHAAVSLMRVGQEGTFVLPSSLAFSERGIPGLLPPWTPVEYEVRLISIERKAARP